MKLRKWKTEGASKSITKKRAIKKAKKICKKDKKIVLVYKIK